MDTLMAVVPFDVRNAPHGTASLCRVLECCLVVLRLALLWEMVMQMVVVTMLVVMCMRYADKVYTTCSAEVPACRCTAATWTKAAREQVLQANVVVPSQ